MKTHKFTWIDGLILAVAVALIAGTCLKFFVLDTTSVNQEAVDFSYQIKITNVRQFTLDALKVGDTVYDDEGKGQVGTITDISFTDAVTTATYPDGSAAKAAVDGRYDITLTLSAQGVPSGGTYKVGTYAIKVNQDTLYFTKYSTWTGTVIAIGGAAQ